jgi:hypothetical protein
MTTLDTNCDGVKDVREYEGSAFSAQCLGPVQVQESELISYRQGIYTLEHSGSGDT